MNETSNIESDETIKSDEQLEQVILPDATSEIITSVYKKCLREKASKQLKYPIEDAENRTSYYTGFSLQYINEAISDVLTTLYVFPVPISLRIDIYEGCLNTYRYGLLNSQHFLRMYKQFQSNYEHIRITSLEFQKMLSIMRYKLVKTKDGQKSFIENPESTNERFIFLKTINSVYSHDQNVYFVDARYLDLKKNFMKPWAIGLTVENSEELLSGYIFYHIISAEGYLGGITCAQLCYEDFYNWMYSMVLPKLPPNSTIVMDKSEYHGKLVQNYITPFESKAYLIDKLQKYNIPASLKMHKSELYELAIKHVPPVEHKYELDEVFKSHGHDIIRLPHTLYDLSMTDLLWDEMRRVYSIRDIQSVPDLNSAVILTLESEYTLAKWMRLKTEVKNYVRRLYEIEISTDSALSKYSFCNTKFVDCALAKTKVVNKNDPIVIN